jgi:hypothetical protein
VPVSSHIPFTIRDRLFGSQRAGPQ